MLDAEATRKPRGKQKAEIMIRHGNGNRRGGISEQSVSSRKAKCFLDRGGMGGFCFGLEKGKERTESKVATPKKKKSRARLLECPWLYIKYLDAVQG